MTEKNSPKDAPEANFYRASVVNFQSCTPNSRLITLNSKPADDISSLSHIEMVSTISHTTRSVPKSQTRIRVRNTKFLLQVIVALWFAIAPLLTLNLMRYLRQAPKLQVSGDPTRLVDTLMLASTMPNLSELLSLYSNKRNIILYTPGSVDIEMIFAHQSVAQIILQNVTGLDSSEIASIVSYIGQFKKTSILV